MSSYFTERSSHSSYSVPDYPNDYGYGEGEIYGEEHDEPTYCEDCEYCSGFYQGTAWCDLHNTAVSCGCYCYYGELDTSLDFEEEEEEDEFEKVE